MTKRALILGVGGQDGSYLCDILLERGYAVHGLYRHTSTPALGRIAHCRDALTLHPGDVLDAGSLASVIRAAAPHEIYHVADQDNVGWSARLPSYTVDITAGSVARLLDVVRRLDPSIRVYVPVSATMFGDAPPPQNEETPFNPQSPYACAKAHAYHLARHYRREHGLFVATAILYNHDSPRRTEDYLLSKICRGAARMARGKQQALELGNLDLVVDVGYARDYMEAAVDLLRLERPDDYVLASGWCWTIRQMAEEAFRAAGVRDGKILLDPTLARGPARTLVGDTTKARRDFGFRPRHTLPELIALIVRDELERCDRRVDMGQRADNVKFAMPPHVGGA